MNQSAGRARFPSPFELLWLHASEAMSLETLGAVRSSLEAKRNAALVSLDRETVAFALNEVDGLIVSRLARELASATAQP
jgi:hypothetical protein